MNSEAMRETLRVTKALADIQRVRILMMLRHGELCVCQIVEVLGLAPSTVSKHLSILDVARLVESRKDGRWAYFRLPDKSASALVATILKWLDGALVDDSSIERDKSSLRKVVACDPQTLCCRRKGGAARHKIFAGRKF